MSTKRSDQSHETWKTKHKKNSHNYTTVALWRTVVQEFSFMVLISILVLVLVPSKGCWFLGLAGSQELELELLSLTFQKFLLKATQKMS